MRPIIACLLKCLIGLSLCLLLMVPLVSALADDRADRQGLIAVDRLTLLRLQVGVGSDDVNQDGERLSASDGAVWVGNGESVDSGYLGVRFTDVPIPPGVEILSAHLVLFALEPSWIGLEMDLAFETSTSSEAFAVGALPAQREWTSARSSHSSDIEWIAPAWYAFENMATSLQEVIDGTGWQDGNSLAVIVRGNGDQWARKFAASYEGDPVHAPSLVVLYRVPVPSS